MTNTTSSALCLTKLESAIVGIVRVSDTTLDSVQLLYDVCALVNKNFSIGQFWAAVSNLVDYGILAIHEGERTPERGNRPKALILMARGGERIYELAKKDEFKCLKN